MLQPLSHYENNSVMWNSMIHPLLNMTIKGALWYQGTVFAQVSDVHYSRIHHMLLWDLSALSGEANVEYHQDKYNCSFPAMIDDWRMAFHLGSGGQTAIDFPFGFVQVCLESVFYFAKEKQVLMGR